jgi:hypothetical protein
MMSLLTFEKYYQKVSKEKIQMKCDPFSKSLTLLTLPPTDLNKYTDHDCLRFLRGCNGDIEKAHTKLQGYHDWFHNLMDPISALNGLHFSPNTLIYTPEHLVNHPTGQGMIPVSHSGFDRDGRPLYWEKTGAVQANFNVVK